MAQISRRYLSKKILRELESIFITSFSAVNSKRELTNLLHDLLTPTEKIILTKRLAIALMLKKKYDYEIIKETIKVSQGTIALVNQKIKFSGKGYHKVLNKIIQNQKIIEALNKLEDIILSTLTLGRGKGTSVWRAIQRRSKKFRKQPLI